MMAASSTLASRPLSRTLRRFSHARNHSAGRMGQLSPSKNLEENMVDDIATVAKLVLDYRYKQLGRNEMGTSAYRPYGNEMVVGHTEVMHQTTDETITAMILHRAAVAAKATELPEDVRQFLIQMNSRESW